MNIGMANIKFFKQGQIEELVNGDFVQPRLSLIFKGKCCSGWCGESHALPYPGYSMALYTL